MNIPDKAVDAAVQALFEDGCGEPKVDASTALEAAYKFIAAQAWEEGHDAGCHDGIDDHYGYAMKRTNPYAEDE